MDRLTRKMPNMGYCIVFEAGVGPDVYSIYGDEDDEQRLYGEAATRLGEYEDALKTSDTECLSPDEVAELLAIGNQGGKKVMAAEKEANALRERVRELETRIEQQEEMHYRRVDEYAKLTGDWAKEKDKVAALTAERDGLKEWKREADADGWVKCSERLPGIPDTKAYSENVLVLTEHNLQFVAFMLTASEWYIPTPKGSIPLTFKPIKWRPLPEASEDANAATPCTPE
jgi:hypothetical protein